MKVELIPLELLLPHEEIIPDKVIQLEKMTIRWNAYVLPLVVDKITGTILDGHHRYNVAKKLDLQCLPCVLVDYLSDDSIELDIWPKSGRKISNRTITISIMRRINKDLEKKIFLKSLEDKIYSELNLLN